VDHDLALADDGAGDLWDRCVACPDQDDVDVGKGFELGDRCPQQIGCTLGTRPAP
jgi:hypothetical protein